ncbi:hypothetical protein JVY00_03025 [Tsukamurella tyrosinosolvens]|uniref:hypothetical protein n=1 Tax=Tsukamurella tyrosinosolvens TaxID=57704 RepID=UPI001AF7C6D0|nr:hypothetical protein [Tsukamurella tyrosinosolvens]QRY85094.1 hypothetical protein JVY00_03025 [Tsukamurella tyrosinosolvens]
MRRRSSAALIVAALALVAAGCSLISGDDEGLPSCASLGDVQNPSYEELNGSFSRLVEKDWQRMTSPAYVGESDWKSQEEFTTTWRMQFDDTNWEQLLPTLQPGAVGKHRVLLCEQNREVLHRTKSDTTKEQVRVTNRLIGDEPLYALYVNGRATCRFTTTSSAATQQALHETLCPNAH